MTILTQTGSVGSLFATNESLLDNVFPLPTDFVHTFLDFDLLNLSPSFTPNNVIQGSTVVSGYDAAMAAR